MAICHASETFLTQDSASKSTCMLSLVTTAAKSPSSPILWVVLSWRRDESEAICVTKTVEVFIVAKPFISLNGIQMPSYHLLPMNSIWEISMKSADIFKNGTPF